MHGRAGGRRHMDVHRRRHDTRNRGHAVTVSTSPSWRPGRGIHHRRTLPRLDPPAGVRPRASGRSLDRGAGARVGRARVRTRRKIRPARQARAIDSFASRRCPRRQHRPRLQEFSVRLESGQRQGSLGSLRPHAGVGVARRRPPRLVASFVRDRRRGRGARPVPVRRGDSGRHPRFVHAAHRPSRVGPAVEPRSLGFAGVLQDAGGSGGRGGEASPPPDSLRRADPRRPRRVERGHALRLRMGPRPLCESTRGTRGDQGTPSAGLRVGISVRVRALAAVRGPRVARLSPDHDGG